VAAGRITSIDLSAVQSAEGVIDVLTHKDIPAEKDIGPVFPGDPLLCTGDVLFMGQPVFIVVANTHQLARRAVKLANITIDKTRAVLDIDTAMQEKSYVRPPFALQRGDANSALNNSTHTLTGVQRIGGQEHFYLEGQVAVATPCEYGGVRVASSNQNPTEAQHIVAKVLGVPMHRVTLTTRRMGGGFGGKETQANLCCALAAMVAVKHQRVASCRLSRHDDMVMTGKRHGFYTQWQVGFSDEGVINGVKFTLAGQCGHSADLSDAIVDRAMFHCDNSYYYPAAHIEGLRCKTNTVSNTAFRGFGGPQGMLACEAMMDHIAEYLQQDPLEIRKRNLYNTTDKNITPYFQTIDYFNVPRIIDRLEKTSNYAKRRMAIEKFNAANTVLKRGMALTPVKFGISFTVKHLNQGGALLHLYSDGSVQLNHGGTEMGQGLMVKVQQIVAHELGMNIERIAITATQTDKVPNTSPTAASSGTDINGAAARNAALKLKTRLVEFLVKQHDLAKDSDVSFANDIVTAGDIAYSWEKLAHAAYMERVSLSATGFYKTPLVHFDRQTAKWLTHEEIQWTHEGRLASDGPATYKIPAIGDTPLQMNVELLDDAPNEASTVFRSKAVGEPPLMLAISVFCAIKDAVRAADPTARDLEAPATPESVLNAIGGQVN